MTRREAKEACRCPRYQCQAGCPDLLFTFIEHGSPLRGIVGINALLAGLPFAEIERHCALWHKELLPLWTQEERISLNRDECRWMQTISFAAVVAPVPEGAVVQTPQSAEATATEREYARRREEYLNELVRQQTDRTAREFAVIERRTRPNNGQRRRQPAKPKLNPVVASRDAPRKLIVGQ